MLPRLLLDIASPAGPAAALSVLIFHRVLPTPDPLFPEVPDAARFDLICGWLQSWCNVLPLSEAVRRLRERSLPARALAITFDDGYADNHVVAGPILLRRQLPATFFVATGFLDGGRMFNDRVIEAIRGATAPSLDLDGVLPGAPRLLPLGTARQRREAIDAVIGALRYLPSAQRLDAAGQIERRARAKPSEDLMMTSRQVVDMRRSGFTIGGHTVSHPILSGLPDDEARREMAQGKAFLENLLQEEVALFAYPNGRPGQDYTERTVALAREVGFQAAVSTAWGVARAGSDAFQIPRFTPWDRSKLAFGARLAGNAWNRRRAKAATSAAATLKNEERQA